MPNLNFAICCVAYNRPDSLKNLLDSLSDSFYPHDVTLIISIDYSGTNDVENFAKGYEWKYGEKRIISHEKNLGLRNHILSCGDLLQEYDAVIVLEDDVVVAPSYFYFTEQCVEKYKDDDTIAGISLFSFPLNHYNQVPFYPLKTDIDVYLMKIAQSWGQVWMKKSWKAFREWYDRNNEEFEVMPHLPEKICHWPKTSWLKYHVRYCIENDKYFVYPYDSMTTDNVVPGVHCQTVTTYEQAHLLYGKKTQFALNPTVKYDGFFENEAIPEWLGIDTKEICVDFFGYNKNRVNKRYLLTREVLPYKIVKSFALQMKPYEWNIIKNVAGNDLFLYDTTIAEKRKAEDRTIEFARYIYPLTNARGVVSSGLKFQIKKLLKLK